MSGRLESSYRVEVGSEPGQSDLAQRVVDGRSVPELGFREAFSGIAAARAYVRVTALNSCGPGPSSIEAHSRRGCGTSPPNELRVSVSGRRVALGWWPAEAEWGPYWDPSPEVSFEIPPE